MFRSGGGGGATILRGQQQGGGMLGSGPQIVQLKDRNHEVVAVVNGILPHLERTLVEMKLWGNGFNLVFVR